MAKGNLLKPLKMDTSLRKSFLADYQSAIKQVNREEAVKKVFDEYKDFMLSLNVFEALSLGAEMGFWHKEVSAHLN
jgi:hypothetical protein